MGLLMTSVSINRITLESYHRMLTKSKAYARMNLIKDAKYMSLNIKEVDMEVFPDRETERIFVWSSVKMPFYTEKYILT